MSGETEKEVSGWTTDTLREFFLGLLREHDKRTEQRFSEYDHRYEQRFKAQEKATKAALAAAEKASGILENTATQWREQANEWRGAMTDRERSYMPRTEAAVLEKQNASRIEAVIGRLEKLEDRINSREDQRRGAVGAWALIPVIAGSLLAVLGIVAFFNSGQ